MSVTERTTQEPQTPNVETDQKLKTSFTNKALRYFAGGLFTITVGLISYQTGEYNANEARNTLFCNGDKSIPLTNGTELPARESFLAQFNGNVVVIYDEQNGISLRNFRTGEITDLVNAVISNDKGIIGEAEPEHLRRMNCTFIHNP